MTFLAQMARFKRKLTRDRSANRNMDTSTLELLLVRGADVNSFYRVSEKPLLFMVIVLKADMCLRLAGPCC